MVILITPPSLHRLQPDSDQCEAGYHVQLPYLSGDLHRITPALRPPATDAQRTDQPVQEAKGTRRQNYTVQRSHAFVARHLADDDC